MALSSPSCVSLALLPLRLLGEYWPPLLSLSINTKSNGIVFLSSLFAMSIGQQILGGHMIWIAMFIMSGVGALFTRPLESSEDGNRVDSHSH